MATQKTSTVVFTSGSSTQIASNVSTQVGVSNRQCERCVAETTCRLEPEGLSVVVEGFDGADQNGTRLHNRLLLKPGERRVIMVRRAFGQPPAHFTITRTGDGIQISANGT